MRKEYRQYQKNLESPSGHDYEVVAVELVRKHVKAIEDAKTEKMNLKVIQGDALKNLKQLFLAFY